MDHEFTEPDLIVIGAGAAGLAAASEAAAQGARVVLLDAAAAPPRAPRAPGVEMRWGETAWSVAGAFRVDTIGPDGPRHYHAPALIVATGAQERVVPFPGWTTPGVVGLADVLKPPAVRPGERVLLAGCGPLLAQAGAAVLDGGGQVAAIVHLGRRDGQLARLRRAGVTILNGATLAAVEDSGAGLRAVVAAVDAEGRRLAAPPERDFTVNVVAVGHGLMPSTDITRLMRAAHAHDPALGGWHPVLDPDGRSSVPGLYVAGGVDGALAGLAAMRDMGRLSAADHARLSAPLRRTTAGNRLASGPDLAEFITPETIVCRCEGVTRAEIDAAIGAGAVVLNQLKAWTRCGMGPCQGRQCADAAAALLATHGIARPDSGQFTGRTPLRPVPLDRLTGDYAYADIDLPPAAPL